MGSRRPTAASLIGILAMACLSIGAPEALAQAVGVLRVTVTMTAGDGTTTPVQRHALLVSDNPASRAPWRVVTAPDGTARVTLPAGNYTIESDAPLVYQGKAYEWRQTIDVPAGRGTALALTTDNAVVTANPPPAPGTAVRIDAWDLLIQWQASLVTLWTPTTHGAGVVVASTGLLVTTQRVVGDATAVHVQLTPLLKVTGRVLGSDPARDVAVIWIDPVSLGARPPVPMGCDAQARPTVAPGLAISALGMPLRGHPHTAPGHVRRVQPTAIAADFDFAVGSAGGPVFAADGTTLGLLAVPGGSEGTGEHASVVPAAAVCDALAAALARMTGAPPSPAPLPVEPAMTVDDNGLREAMARRTGSLTPYQTTSSTFDIALITPLAAYAGMQGAMDFGQWSRYVANRLPVLLVRVTPKQVESFWVKMARGAAMTQGIVLPPIKHFSPGFARMRALCDDRDVTPIQPFVIERRVSETSAVREGLYVFAADALGPQCKTVTLEVFSEKTPGQRETAVIPASVLTQLGKDLASYRTPDQ